MGLLAEFKEFAMKGSVVDLAVGVVIGGAFGKIVSSLVNDIIMPPIGLITGGVDFSSLKVVIHKGAAAVVDPNGVVMKAAVPDVTINYGNFVNNSVDFVIVAASIFMVVKLMSMAKRAPAPPPAVPPPPTKEEILLTDIRDILKART
jgi:large conductance mechanosensitive channel